MSTSPEIYDVVRYPAGTFESTHPSRLATIATLFGMSPAPVEKCRVLELGAGEGANILPMAAALPGSTFVAVDRAARPIAVGEETRARLGLDNVKMVQADILDLELPAGSFDYIIAHGLYAWVPEPVRDRVMALIRRALAPSGVAFVSYNTLPGGYQRSVIVDMMRYHTRGLEDPMRRVAQGRAMLGFAAEHVAASSGTYRHILVGQRDRIGRLSDEYLCHDDLAEHREVFYFHEFMAHAAAHELRYLGEAVYADMQDQMFPPEVRAMLQASGDIVAHGQYLDFLLGRAFRRTLLVPADVELDRVPVGERARRFFFTSNARPVDPAEVGSSGPLRLENPDGLVVGLASPMAKAALLSLLDATPLALSFDELASATRARLAAAGNEALDEKELGELLLSLYGGTMIGVSMHRPVMVRTPGPRPRVPALARLQASEGRPVINAWHCAVNVDPDMRAAIALVDGSLDRAALIEALGSRGLDGAASLERMGVMALLEA